MIRAHRSDSEQLPEPLVVAHLLGHKAPAPRQHSRHFAGHEGLMAARDQVEGAVGEGERWLVRALGDVVRWALVGNHLDASGSSRALARATLGAQPSLATMWGGRVASLASHSPASGA